MKAGREGGGSGCNYKGRKKLERVTSSIYHPRFRRLYVEHGAPPNNPTRQNLFAPAPFLEALNPLSNDRCPSAVGCWSLIRGQ